MPDVRAHLAANLRKLREARGLSQQRIAELAGVPRPTWASLESGSGNPTLAVLVRVAFALRVSIEELLAPPRTEARLFRRGELRERRRGGARLRPLLPEPVPGLQISRLELDPRAHLRRVPHTPGTREYLCCERGAVEVTASGERWRLAAGEVLAFRGDQPHVYANPDARRTAVALTVVCLAPRS